MSKLGVLSVSDLFARRVATAQIVHGLGERVIACARQHKVMYVLLRHRLLRTAPSAPR